MDAGFHVAVAAEHDKHALSTYQHNMAIRQTPPPTLIPGDLREANIPAAFNDRSPGDECHLLIGGPPCQGFSTHRLNDAGVKDKRNSLLITYFEIMNQLKPWYFVVENVPGMLWQRHRDYLTLFYDLADKAGYDLRDPVVLDARDYGVPQRRKRVFILGQRRDRPAALAWPPASTHCASGNAPTVGKKPWVSCRSAFTAPPTDDENNVHMNHGTELVDAFKRTPRDGGSRKDSGRVLPCHKDHDGHKDVYGRIDRNCPAPTMTTACINPSKGRFVHPFEHHGITLRQAARIQTFPDNFVFHGGLTAGGRQIGNAVPVKMAEALLRPLFTAITGTQAWHHQAAA